MATATIETTHRVTVADLLAGLGNIPPDRVRLVPTPGTATEADVVQIWEREKRPCELVEGTLLEKTVGMPESYFAWLLGLRIGIFLDAHGLGFCLGEAGMARLAPGLVRIPDLSYISWDRFPDRKIPQEAFLHLAPDLAVEVISPGNSKAEMDRKLARILHRRARLVWYVYPRTRTVKVFTGPERPTTVREHETLDGGNVLPGFALPLKDLFAKA